MYVSIGIDCGTANILKELGLRKCSLPFDWVVTYEGVTNIIRNNFKNYLPENNLNNDYEKMNKKSGTFFMHNEFPRDLETMNRRIDRFKYILESSNEKIVFVRKSHGSHHHTTIDKRNKYTQDPINLCNDIQDAKKLDLLLCEKYPNLEYEIHVILICDKCFTNVNIDESISHNIRIHNVSRPYPENVNMTNPYYFDDICKQIFK